jgi:hypothetical protein
VRKLSIFLLYVNILIGGTYQEIRIDDTSMEVIHRLQDLGVDLDHVQQKKGKFIQFSISEALTSVLSEDGIIFHVIHDDLEAYYASRLYNISSRDFDYGSMGGYYTHDEVVEHLVELSEDYPNLVSQLQYLGESYEGRPIYAVKLSDNPNSDEGLYIIPQVHLHQNLDYH